MPHTDYDKRLKHRKDTLINFWNYDIWSFLIDDISSFDFTDFCQCELCKAYWQKIKLGIAIPPARLLLCDIYSEDQLEQLFEPPNKRVRYNDEAPSLPLI